MFRCVLSDVCYFCRRMGNTLCGGTGMEEVEEVIESVDVKAILSDNTPKKQRKEEERKMNEEEVDDGIEVQGDSYFDCLPLDLTLLMLKSLPLSSLANLACCAKRFSKMVREITKRRVAEAPLPSCYYSSAKDHLSNMTYGLC